MVFLFLISSELLMFNKGGHTVIESYVATLALCNIRNEGF